jgi:hypothetical protein
MIALASPGSPTLTPSATFTASTTYAASPTFYGIAHIHYIRVIHSIANRHSNCNNIMHASPSPLANTRGVAGMSIFDVVIWCIKFNCDSTSCYFSWPAQAIHHLTSERLARCCTRTLQAIYLHSLLVLARMAVCTFTHLLRSGTSMGGRGAVCYNWSCDVIASCWSWRHCDHWLTRP